MLHPEADGLVAAVRGILVLAEDGHEEVLGHEQLQGCSPASIFQDLVVLIDGAAFDYVERVAEISCIPGTYLHLEVGPDAAVEAVELRLHVGVEEGLTVGFERVPTVSRCDDVSSRVARTAVVTACGAIHLGDVVVLHEVVLTLDVASAVRVVPTECCPALRFLCEAPFYAVVDLPRTQALDEEHIRHAPRQLRHFHPSGFGVLGCFVGIGVDGEWVFVVVVVRRAATEAQRQECSEQE